MVSLDQIRPNVEEIIHTLDLILYDMKWRHEGDMQILEISILKKDNSMDIDTCALASEKISIMLDEKDCIPFEYYLEVCSPGAERVLNNDDEIRKSIGEYVYVKLKNPKCGIDEITGFLMDANDDFINISYMQKAVKKNLEIERNNIKLIRLSVKL